MLVPVARSESFRDRSTLVRGMSRTTSSGELIAHAMTTDDQARARRNAKRLNEQRRSESFRWAVRELGQERRWGLCPQVAGELR